MMGRHPCILQHRMDMSMQSKYWKNQEQRFFCGTNIGRHHWIWQESMDMPTQSKYWRIHHHRRLCFGKTEFGEAPMILAKERMRVNTIKAFQEASSLKYFLWRAPIRCESQPKLGNKVVALAKMVFSRRSVLNLNWVWDLRRKRLHTWFWVRLDIIAV